MTWRLLLRTTLVVHIAIGSAAIPADAQSPTLTRAQLQAKAKAENVREIAFTTNPNFLKFPSNLFMGEGIGIASNSKGHIFVYTRSQMTRLFEFDANGSYVREIGEGLYGFTFAHAVRVDPQDNIWAVDEGSNMVIKFSPEERVLLVLGRRPESVEGLKPSSGTQPEASPYVFNRPTDVAWDPAGDIFVADGYGNSRVVKYDKYGRFVKTVGTRGNAPTQLNTPHSMTNDADGNIYVADRGNSRIQVFDSDLNLKKIIEGVGAPWTVCVTKGPHQYLYASNSWPDNNEAAIGSVTGEIYKMELDGTILGKFGHAGKAPGEFATTHGIDCRNDNELLISEITAWRVQKVSLSPLRSGPGSK